MSDLKLVIVANDDLMLVPRVVQILSRRGYRLVELTSLELDTGDWRYECAVRGDERWQNALPGLISKLPTVKEVSHA